MLLSSRIHHGDRGSIPLVLLVVIVTSGLLAALVARTVHAQRQSTFDRSFTSALPVADAGVEVALARLNADETFVSANDGGTYEQGTFPVGHTSIEYLETLNGEEYAWTLTRDSQLGWTVDSTSTVGDVTRSVAGEINERGLVNHAAFTDNLMELGGANIVDSYNSTGTGTWCTKFGVVGSNDTINFSGSSTSSTDCTRPNRRTVDGVVLYDWQNNPATGGVTEARPGGNRCTPSNSENCVEESHATAGVFPRPVIEQDRVDLATDRSVAFIEDALAACSASTPLTSYPNASYPAGVELAPLPGANVAASTGRMGMPGAHYCFEDMTFSRSTALASTATADNPVIIFVRRDVTVLPAGASSGLVVGCPQAACTAYTHRPPAGALRIFVLEGNVSIGRHARFTGVMYAPRSDCSGGNGNAQSEIFGAMVCKTMDNIGGWLFHYDDALRNIGGGVFGIASWREEIPTP